MIQLNKKPIPKANKLQNCGFILTHKKIIRYVDQILLAISMLAINIIIPIIFPEKISAQILFEASLVLLGSIISASAFGTPYAARPSSSAGDELNAIKLYLAYGAIVAAIASTISIFSGEKKIISFWVISFAYAWGAVDLLRRVALKTGKENISASISFFALISTTGAIIYSQFYNSYSYFWAAAASLLGIFCVASTYFLYRKGAIYKGETGAIDYIKHTRTGSILTLFTYALGWLSTQGFFVAFKSSMNDAVFIETKWTFSLLGVFGIAMAVQENKYQPIISNCVSENNQENLSIARKKIIKENLVVSAIAVAVAATAITISPQISLLTVFLLLAHRQLFANSKYDTYVLRAKGKYREIFYAHIVICGLAFIFSIACSQLGINPIAAGLFAYGLSSTIFFQKLNQNRAFNK